MNNCRSVNVFYKMDKILFYFIKKEYCKTKDKKLYLNSLEYNSIKNLFFGMYLNILKLTNLETNEREMRILLKSLSGTLSLSKFVYENEKAYGLIYNRKKLNNKKLNGNIGELKTDVVKSSVNLKFKVEKANELFLISLPNWINEVEIKSNYEEEDFKYLLTKFYKAGILNKYGLATIVFGYLTKQTDIGFLKYVTKLK